MPSMTAEKGTFILNGFTAGLLHSYRRPIATDICKSSGLCDSVPIEIDCSLACTAIGWPMQAGYLFIELFTEPTDCPPPQRSSIYCSGLSVYMGCKPSDPIVDGVWQGQSLDNCIALTKDGQSYGLTLQTCARMTVGSDGKINVNVEINRIAPASDITPPPQDNLNQIVPCVTFSKTLGWHNPAPEINVQREYTYPGGKEDNKAFDVVISNPDTCPLDIKSAQMSFIMIPYAVGCNGTAEAGAESKCAFDTGTKTYSCFSALIKPSQPGAFNPYWTQLGVNTLPTNGNFGCSEGINSKTTVTPPEPAILLPQNPLGFRYPDIDILNIGCPGEDPVNSDYQQIQYGSGGLYEILIKSVNKGGFCVAMKGGGGWSIGIPVSFNSTIFDQTGHYIRTYSFPGLPDNPIAIIYGLQFPQGITSQCLENENVFQGPTLLTSSQPEGSQEQQPVSFSMPPIEERRSIKETIKKMNDVKTKPCVHLGMQLETVPSCGCAGGTLHECAKHGVCRIFGNTKEMNCWRCPDYIDQASQNDKI
jgi:hypothetical protein